MSKCGVGRGAGAHQGTKVGERRAVACPGDDVGMQTASFKLNLAEACPGIDAGGTVEQRRVQTPMHGELEQRRFQMTM